MAVAVRESDAVAEVAAIVGDLIDRGERVSIHAVRDKVRELLSVGDNPAMVTGAVEWFMTYGVPQIVRSTEFREQLFKRAIVKRVGLNQPVEKKLTNAELEKLWVTVSDKTIEWTEV